MVSVPTRGDKILDLVLVDDISFVSEALVTDPFLDSDHNSVTVYLTFEKANNVRRSGGRNDAFDFSKADWISYERKLSLANINDIFDSEDVDTIWQKIRNLIKDAASDSIPRRKNSKFLSGAPLEGEVLRAFRARKKIRRHTKSSTSSWSRDLRERADKHLSLAIRNSRISFEKKIATSCKTNVKGFWKLVRASLANRPSVSRVFSPSGSLSLSDADTAEYFNNFFVSVFTREDSHVPPFPARTEHKLCNVDISFDVVAKVVRSLPANSAPGPDGITYQMIKEGGATLIEIMCRLFCMLVTKGVLPSEWKLAYVVPQSTKKGSRARCDNYRPISLTCSVCKILEVILKKTILNFFLDNRLLNFSQHGFLPQRSSSTALLAYLEDVTLSVDEGKNVDAIYLDLSKAFDSVPHLRLIKKLKGYGIGEPLITWLSAFLMNRQQFVKIGDSLSRLVDVVSGVPQGSILGPLLQSWKKILARSIR